MLALLFSAQGAAYEIQYGLVGSEMCISDRGQPMRAPMHFGACVWRAGEVSTCRLYTSDAADELTRVDSHLASTTSKTRTNM